MSKVKPFKLDKDTQAELILYADEKRPFIVIDTWTELTPNKARRFARWLCDAADSIDGRVSSVSEYEVGKKE